MEDPRILFYSSPFKRARERISSKSIDNLGKRTQKVSPALASGLERLERKAYQLPPPNTERNNVWPYTSIPHKRS